MTTNITKWLVINHQGDAKIYIKRPTAKHGEAIYKLKLQIPSKPTIAGTISIVIPDGLAYDVAVDQLLPIDAQGTTCPDCGNALTRIHGEYEYEDGDTTHCWHWLCEEHGRYLDDVFETNQ